METRSSQSEYVHVSSSESSSTINDLLRLAYIALRYQPFFLPSILFQHMMATRDYKKYYNHQNVYLSFGSRDCLQILTGVVSLLFFTQT
jgi:hypothetical protein